MTRQSPKLCCYSPYCDQSRYLTIIELIMCACGNRLLERPMSPSPKSQVVFASAFSSIGDFFSYFWHSNFLRYGHFIQYMNMHAMKGTATRRVHMHLHLRRSRAVHACGALRLVGFSSNNVMSSARRPLIMTTGTRVWTLNPSNNNNNNNNGMDY